MQDIKWCCQILGLEVGASRAEVKQAYRDLVHVWHPDRFNQNPRLQQKAETMLKEINVAYGMLLDHVQQQAAAHKSRKQPHPPANESPESRDGNPRTRVKPSPRQTIMALQKAIRQNPGDAQAYCNLGLTYLHVGRTPEALETFQKAVSLDPQSAAAHAGRGVALSRLGKFLQAVSAFRRALILNPEDALSYLNLGITYRRLGRLRRGMLAIIQAIRLQPDSPEAHYELGLTNLSMQNRAFALEEYKILLQLDQKLACKLFDFIYK